jgi:hypothetical protein
MRSDDADLWLLAINEELQSLADHATFSLVPRPIGVPVIKGKWGLKVKRNELGERHKARFVAKGFAQQLHKHYEAVWAPTAHYSAFRL